MVGDLWYSFYAEGQAQPVWSAGENKHPGPGIARFCIATTRSSFDNLVRCTEDDPRYVGLKMPALEAEVR